ncbi:MAG: phosphatase PAP2 family protein [Chitinophagaceae bacterium]|nr:MAG: phosphatase PAP2 family protein [Chitinophagaceae bacterium]
MAPALFDETYPKVYICAMPFSILTVSFWQTLQDWDTRTFLALNNGLANPFFDTVLPFFRDSVFWAPLYLFILLFVFFNYGTRGIWWTLAFLSTVALADLTGTYVFKETIQRIRPCNEPMLAGQVRLVIHACPGGYSFLSNHAANHFGLATFMVLSFKHTFKPWIYLFYLWALLICFAQLYVGVHYPSDILAGMLLGTLAGFITATVYRQNFGKLDADI